MRRTAARRAPAFVLIAAMAVVGSALLISTGLVFTTSVEVTDTIAQTRRAQSLALAWSGLQAVMSRLGDQRQLILDGDIPRLNVQYTIYESGRGLGVARILPLGTDDQRLVAEGGRLSINRTDDAASLEWTGLVDATLAQAIVDFRDNDLGRPFQSLDELLLVPGMTKAVLYGSDEPRRTESGGATSAGGPTSAGVGALTAAVTGRARGLADVITVCDWEPAIMRDGSPRINLNAPWSDDMARRIDQRLGRGEAVLIKQLFDSGVTFDSESRLIEVMRSNNVDPKDWPTLLDTFTTDTAALHFGRIDLTTAPLEALQTLPGVTPDQAARIVSARQTMTPADRASIAWPLLKGIIPPPAYEDLAGRITTRCFAWRVRIQTGLMPPDQPDGELLHPMTFEAVIDLADSTPRLAYLRDITLLETIAQLALTDPEPIADKPAATASPAGATERATVTAGWPAPWMVSPRTGASAQSEAVPDDPDQALGDSSAAGESSGSTAVRPGARLGRWRTPG